MALDCDILVRRFKKDMRVNKCSHTWEMVNITHGLIVMKKCFHCSKVSSCFYPGDNPPLEPCHEEEHFWNFVEGNPCFHFDLKCNKCGTLVKLGALAGLMLCTGCDQTCQVDVLRQKSEPEGIRVYIALGHRPIDERKQLSQEQLAILEDYFNQQRHLLKFGVKIVTHEMVKSIDNCYAEVIKDVNTLFTTPSGRK